MSIAREGAFETAITAAHDAASSFRIMPRLYLAWFLISAVEALLFYATDKAHLGEAINSMQIFILVLYCIAASPLWVRLLQYFSVGHTDRSLIRVRVIVRSILGPAVIWLPFMLCGIALLVWALPSTDAPEFRLSDPVFVGLLVLTVATYCLGVRFVTLYTHIALGEDRPIRRAWADTGGEFWRTLAACSAGLLVVIFILGAYWVVLMAAGVHFTSDIPAPTTGPMLALISLLEAVFGTVLPAYISALLGRFYRKLRAVAHDEAQGLTPA